MKNFFLLLKFILEKKDFFFSFLLILKAFLYGKKAYLKKSSMTSVDYFMRPIEYFHILLEVTYTNDHRTRELL